MPKREVKLYLQDIKDCIKKIEKYTKNLTFDKFRKDDMAVDAVVRNVEIIGEAANNIPQKIREKYPDVPWRDVVDMRNKIIHEYFGADIKIVWGTVKDSIPELKKALSKSR